MTLNKLIIGGLFILSFTGCGENFQSTFVGKANVSNLGCSQAVDGQYDIRVSAQVSGDMNLTVVEMINSSTKRSDGTASYFTTDVKMNAPFVGGSEQFSQINLRIFQDSEIDNVSVSGNMNVDRTQISGLKITRVKEETAGSGCRVEINAPLLTRE